MDQAIDMVGLHAEPENALIDEEIHITINDLGARQRITVLATVDENCKGKFYSYAYYTADLNGVVDLSMHESEGGSYTGRNGMGLFCTMTPSPLNKHPFGRLTIQNVELPLKFKLVIFSQHLLLCEMTSATSITELNIKRWYKGQGVKRIVVCDGNLRGCLFTPNGSGPFPAVVDLFGSVGGLMEFRGALLASRGFVAFSLALFHYKDLPETFKDIRLEYFEEAKDFLMTHKSVQKGGIGIIGASSGGTLALAAASYIPDFKCCVSISGPVFAQYSTLHYGKRTWKPASYDITKAYILDNGLVFKNCLDGQHIECNSSPAIEFFKSRCSFLFMFCDADLCINMQHHKTTAERLLLGSDCDYEIKVYHGAGHLLEPPYSPHNAATYDRVAGMPERWGGNTKDHAIAQSKAWDDLLSFLNKKLNSNKSKL